MKVHCSFCDTVMACSGALLRVEHPYNPPSEASMEGTAAHAAIEKILSCRANHVDVCEEIADTHGVGLDSLTFLVGEARRAWSALRDNFPNPQFEKDLRSALVRGRADLISYGPDHASILDWKFGQSTRPHPHQLTAYASALRADIGIPTSGHIDVFEVHVRAGTWQHDMVTADYLDQWESALARRIQRPGEQWAPATETCRYCPSRMDCPARAGHARNVAELITDIVDLGPTRDSLAVAYDRAEFLRGVLFDFDAALRDALHDGPLPLPDGRTVELRETTRESIQVAKAWPVLHERLGWSPETLLGLLTAPKGALTKRIQTDAPKGHKTKVSAEILDAIRAAGAVEVSTSMRKDVR